MRQHKRGLRRNFNRSTAKGLLAAAAATMAFTERHCAFGQVVSSDTQYTYTGGSAGNFSTGFTPSFSSDSSGELNIGGSATTTITDDLTGTVNINALDFTNTGSTTINSNTLILTANGSSVAPTIFNGVSGTKVTINTVLAGSAGLTYAGLGSVALNAAESYTGTTTVNGGTLAVTGSLASTALSLGGGTFLFSTTGTNSESFATTALTAGASAATSTVSTDTLNLGALSRSVGATVDFYPETGTVTTTTGNTNGIIGGYAAIGAFSGISANWATSAATGGTAGAITPLSTYYEVTSSNNTTTPTDPTSNVDFSAASLAPTWGTTTVNSLRFNAGTTSLTFPSNGTLTITSGGILETRGASGGVVELSGGTLEAAAGADVIIIGQKVFSFACNISNNGSTASAFTDSNNGQVNLLQSNSYTGGTYINVGVLAADLGTSLGTGTAYIGAAGSNYLATLMAVDGATQTFTNNISVNPGGSRVLELAAGSTNAIFSGPITLQNGATLGFGVGGGGSVTLSGGVTGTGNLQLGSPSTTAGTGTIIISASPINIAGTLSDSVTGGLYSGTISISAPIQGSTAVSQNNSADQMVLSGANTYSGATNVTAGVLDYQTLSAQSANTATKVSAGGILALGVGGATTFTAADFAALDAGNTAGTNVSNVTIDPSAGVGIDTTSATAGSLTYSAAITGSRSFTKLGTGALTLTGASTYTGATAVGSGGTMIVNSTSPNTSASLANTSSVTVAGTFKLISTVGTGGTANLINDNAIVVLNSGSKTYLDLAGGTEVVFELIENGVTEPPGVYAATNSGLLYYDTGSSGSSFTVTSSPEPGSLSILVIAAGSLLRRRARRTPAVVPI